MDGSGPSPLGSVLKWAVVDRVAGRRTRAPARAPVPQIEPDLEELSTPPSRGLRLTWLGHASWLVQGAGHSVLIDPVLRDSIVGGIRRNVPPGIPIEKLPKIDATLITHNHYDHLDLPTVKAVGAPVIAGQGLEATVKSAKLECRGLAWWSSIELGALRVHFVPAQHWSRRGLFDTNRTLWGGFVLETHGISVYHSGDTAYFDGFKEIGARYPKLAAAMLPIGAYDPEWFMRSQHMSPEDAVRAFVDLKAELFLAMHWGTFKLTDEPLLEPPERLAAEWARLGLDESRKRVLAVGESLLQLDGDSR